MCSAAPVVVSVAVATVGASGTKAARPSPGSRAVGVGAVFGEALAVSAGPRRRHDGGKPCQRFDGRHHALGHPPASRLLDAGGNVAVATHPETGERECRAGEIAAQALASKIVVCGEMHAGVEVEAFVRHGVVHQSQHYRLQNQPHLIGRIWQSPAEPRPLTGHLWGGFWGPGDSLGVPYYVRAYK